MASKPNALLVLAAALYAGAACERAPVEPRVAETPELAPLPPATNLVITPLDGATTSFTNEMQAAKLRKETSELGISQVGKSVVGVSPRDGASEPPPPMTEAERAERLEQLRAMRRQFTQMRRNIDAARDKSVALEGRTAGVIPGIEKGGALEVSQEAPGRWSGLHGGSVEAGERVIDDAAAWTGLWSRLSREETPAVDFGASRVAAVFLGPRPSGGYRARLASVAEGKGTIVVHWREETPKAGSAPPPGETAPFLLVSVPKDARPVKFDKAAE